MAATYIQFPRGQGTRWVRRNNQYTRFSFHYFVESAQAVASDVSGAEFWRRSALTRDFMESARNTLPIERFSA